LAYALLRNQVGFGTVLCVGGALDHRSLEPDDSEHAQGEDQDGDERFK